jgi:hypothetical protein
MHLSIFLSIGLVLIFAGCTVIDGGHTPITDVNFRQGVKEVTLDVFPNAPPEQVYENSQFEVGFTLRNQGGYDATDGVISFGLEQHYVNVLNDAGSVVTSYPFKLQGASISYPSGETIIKTFRTSANKTDEMSEYHDSDIYLNVCYRYQTVANPSICIDTDPYNMKPQQKACTPEKYTYSGQGAPIAITEIQQELLPDGDYIRPSFLIFIENKGRGQTTNPDKNTAEMCSSDGLTKGDLNTVILRRATLGNGKLLYDYNNGAPIGQILCEPNPLRLKGERDYIRCSLKQQSEIGSDALPKTTLPYVTPFYIQLDYGYTFTVAKTVRILKQMTY